MPGVFLCGLSHCPDLACGIEGHTFHKDSPGFPPPVVLPNLKTCWWAVLVELPRPPLVLYVRCSPPPFMP